MPRHVADALLKHRRQIVEEWAGRMSHVSPRYQARPAEELHRAVGSFFDAIVLALDTGDLEKLQGFASWVAKLRLELGFDLAETHEAFMLGREVAMPILQEEFAKDAPRLIASLSAFQKCLQQAEAIFARTYHELRTSRLLSELRLAQAELACQRAAFSALVEAFGCPVFVVDQSMTVVRANAAAEKLVGPACVPEGEKWPNALGPGVEPTRGAVEEAFASGRTEYGTYRVAGRSYAVTVMPVVEPTGNVAQVVVLVSKPGEGS